MISGALFVESDSLREWFKEEIAMNYAEKSGCSFAFFAGV